MRRMFALLGGPRSGRDDGGYVLPVVLGLGLVMTLTVATALAVTLSGSQKADTDQDWNAALAAAYAGVEDYQSRVENDTSYVRYGNPGSTFSASSTALTLPTGSSANSAFAIDAGGEWATVPGSDGLAQFRYEVDNSQYPLTGVIRIRATGKVGEQTRSVIADLRQDGFSDYVYFTDYEVQDPLITSGNDPHCAAYWWNRPPQRGSGSNCADIQFATGDVINGKVHSNDRLYVCSTRFKGAVTTASQATPLYGTCGTPIFEAGAPIRTPQIIMPPTNAEMKKETRNDLPAEVVDPGCLYTGPTRIVLNANGTMTVYSPFTLKTQIAATKAGASTPGKCGQPGTGAGQLGHRDGATIPTLDHNLLYVQNVPNSSSDANYRAAGDWPSNFSCSGSGGNQRWTFGSGSSVIRYPATDESMPATSTSTTPAYGCRNGDLYIQGTMGGQMTVAAENFVYVTGDLTYADKARDILGIVGQNAVWIWNPMNGYNQAMLSQNRTIYASLLSVAHTIQVQNWDKGSPRGTLTIVGSMAQRFRGTVGTGTSSSISTGYLKSYNYDARLTYMAPPKYLTPTSTTYDMTQIAGVPSAFDANGTPR